MKNYRKLLVCLPIFTIPFLFSELTYETPPDQPITHFHTEGELEMFSMMMADTILPESYNDLFAGSGVCEKCHGFDTLGVASVDIFGEDVNVTDDWRATMMANSAKDPFWRAKVSHEVAVYPQHKEAIEDKCTTCHAPMGHFSEKHVGATHYLMSDLLDDELGLDGVSCLACHQMSETLLGETHSGNVVYDTFDVAYGPYTNPLVSPMLTETGYKPQFSEHISDAGICASCHTLLTETIDFDGNFTGDTFVEQATYHEWLNSAYEDTISCQGCHMPSLDKWPVYLVTGAQTEPRSPYYLHEFVGGNVTMLRLLRNNIEQLGLKANTAQFDEVIEKTVNMLQNRTLNLDIENTHRTPDTAYFEVKLTNKAGHKFPSGYPARRAFVEFVVRSEAGDTLFISGKTDGEYEVVGQNADYEPHYHFINSEDQVQIYELVLGDVNGEVTTVLERALYPLKDNRLPPLGFSTTHEVYDTTEIAGAALTDEDFNHENGTEGSGTDIVHFHIPMNGNLDLLLVSAKVYYQPTPPKWMDEMFSVSTPEIDEFKDMFAATDREPVLMQSAETMAMPISSTQELVEQKFVELYPVPTVDGRLFIQSTQAHELRVYQSNGQQVQYFEKTAGSYELRLKGKGLFVLQFVGKDGKIQTERVVAQ